MDLQEIVGHLRAGKKDPNLLVGFDTADDAGVYRLADDLALVQTVDFITPVVDDPYVFGQIAAANALSDVYAMGGRPLTALNICCFPHEGVTKRDLARILEGAMERVEAAKAVLVGGHSVHDEEMKFGLSVTGIVHPDRILTNAGAKPGDRLILTKPIGTGAIIGGLRKNLVRDGTAEKAIRWMVSLNDRAGRIACEHGARAATDITGFGLAGHAFEMARASGVGLLFRYGSIPRYEEALALIAEGVKTANTALNRELVAGSLEIQDPFRPEEETLLFDPQTSGGLLISLPADRAEGCVREMRAAGDTETAIVGEVLPSDRPLIFIRR